MTNLRRNVTADDVAELAGVSRWTVARAFKPNGSISAKNLQKVLGAAEELGYAPDLLASSLASSRTNLVALLVDDFANPHKLPLLHALTSALQRVGMAAILINIGDFRSPSDALMNASQRRVDAAVLIGVGLSDEMLTNTLGAQRLKKLIILARESRHRNTLAICCDHARAVREIADHIEARGHQRPAYLAGPRTPPTAPNRNNSFRAEMIARGHGAPLVFSVPAYSRELAFEATFTELNSLPPDRRPGVLFCENDILAIGAIDAIRHRLGLRVPQDIAVIGFDDIELAGAPAYDLTTYRQPIEAMVAHLVSVLTEADPGERDIFMPGELIVRSSA